MHRLTLPLAGLALFLAACSGGDAGEPQVTHTSSASAAATPTPATAATATSSPAGTAATTSSTATAAATASAAGATAAPTAAPGSAATATSPATTAPPPPTSAPQPQNVTVAVRDNYFDKAAIAVAPGSTVTWVWQGNEFHNVVGAGFGVQETTKTGSYSFTFATAGTFAYVCQVHESSRPPMVGEVTVK